MSLIDSDRGSTPVAPGSTAPGRGATGGGIPNAGGAQLVAGAAATAGIPIGGAAIAAAAGAPPCRRCASLLRYFSVSASLSSSIIEDAAAAAAAGCPIGSVIGSPEYWLTRRASSFWSLTCAPGRTRAQIGGRHDECGGQLGVPVVSQTWSAAAVAAGRSPS